MATVPELVLKGLAEGLVLRSLEREPATPAELADRLDTMLGHQPSADALARLVDRMAETGWVRPTGDGPEAAYGLTQDGARRLALYRQLPDAFKTHLASLFRLDGEGGGPSDDAAVEPAPDASPDPALVDGAAPVPRVSVNGDAGTDPQAWARAALGALPANPPVQARYATYALDLDTAAPGWRLEVTHHDPGAVGDAPLGPLDFLYLAATRLLYHVEEPAAEPASAPADA